MSECQVVNQSTEYTVYPHKLIAHFQTIDVKKRSKIFKKRQKSKKKRDKNKKKCL